MELSPNKVWERKEWEGHVNDLLRIKHGQENYVPIPDRHNGDAGIEGYSFCGNAYQSFCPEELCSTAELYEKQRDKMTTDINKFIENKDGNLAKFFSSTLIRRWILVVPNHNSKYLVAHAAVKTVEVVEAKLPYVDNSDFRILVWDRGTFKLEESELLEQGVRVLRLERKAITDIDMSEFQTDKSEFVRNIDTKLLKLKKAPQAHIEKTREIMLKQAIHSQNMLTDLKQDYPEYHSQIMGGVIAREEQLYIEHFESVQKSPAQQVEVLKGNLEKKSKLHEDNLECIAAGTVADWIMRCNLDFEQ
ncbi:hypothetical protein [Pseudomonas alvandae]|uniref:hypothetical protein n=1 Tax=Pseudomonas canavaninivorans TaxID=2842348 RepID=UPI002B1E865A|nr:hypothetical protein [Pseudomonas canavaninivorans]